LKAALSVRSKTVLRRLPRSLAGIIVDGPAILFRRKIVEQLFIALPPRWAELRSRSFRDTDDCRFKLAADSLRLHVVPLMR